MPIAAKRGHGTILYNRHSLRPVLSPTSLISRTCTVTRSNTTSAPARIRGLKVRPRKSARTLQPLSELMTKYTTEYEAKNTRELRDKFLRLKEVSKEETLRRAMTAANELLAQHEHHASKRSVDDSIYSKSGRNDREQQSLIVAESIPALDGQGSRRSKSPNFGDVRAILSNGPDPFLAPPQNDTDTTDQGDASTKSPVPAETRVRLNDEYSESAPSPISVLRTVRANLNLSDTSRPPPPPPDKSQDAKDMSKTQHSQRSAIADEEEDDLIDWDALPLSPLLHQGLIEARNKFRTPRPSPKDEPRYDRAAARRISDDYLAGMLGSPIRLCRLTGSRLPSAFLFTTTVVRDPHSEDALEVADIPPPFVWRSDCEPELETQIRDRFLTACNNDPEQNFEISRESTLGRTAPGTAITESSSSETSLTRPRSQPNQLQSYLLATYDLMEYMSNLTHKKYTGKLMPFLWRSKVGQKEASRIHWQANAHNVTKWRMQQEIPGLVKILRPLAIRKGVGVCMNMKDFQDREARLPPSSNNCILAYFGTKQDVTGNGPTFTETVNAFVQSRKYNVEVHDDLFAVKRNANDYRHVVRLRKGTGGTLLFYDMTRILVPEQLQALRDNGFKELVYYFADIKETVPLRQKLYMLAHYMGYSTKAEV